MRAVILWIKKDPPEVYETKFSYWYCKKKTAELTGLSLLEVDQYITAGEAFDKICPMDFSLAIVVSDPEIVFSRVTVGVFFEHFSRGKIIAPVYNVTEYKRQIAEMPYPYVDVDSFVEVSEIVSKKKDCVEVNDIDPACFACYVEDLKRNRDLLLFEVFRCLEKGVALGALVHRFWNCCGSERIDLQNLVPENVVKILDVGCAEGGFGKSLKKKNPSIIVEGVEISSVLASKAMKIYDKVYVGDFEKISLERGSYDLVHMGDVLEHLYDPWNAVRKVYNLLKKGGYFTGSVPNVSHWSIVRQLLLGRFEYIPWGLLCVSHIRFFTFDSFKEILEEAGFVLEYFERLKIPPPPSARKFIQNIMECGWGKEEELLTAEILFRAKKIN